MDAYARQALALLRESPELEGRLRAVWLFGSRARGAATDESDLDLGLLCDPPLGLERTRWMDRLSRAVGCEVDVIDLETAAPVLAWEILTQGKLVLEIDSARTERFLRHARYAAEDAQRRDRMIVLAQSPVIGASKP